MRLDRCIRGTERFSQIGEAFGRRLRDSRLDGCGIAPCDPAHSAAKISEIAYRWRSNDPRGRQNFSNCSGS